MPVPGVVETDLVVVQSCFVFGCLETFLDRPAGADDADKFW